MDEQDQWIRENKRLALQMVPHAKDMMAYLRGRLPPGTHFAVLILPPGQEKRTPIQGSVIAMSTDRDIMVLQAASWVLECMREDAPE